MGRHGTGRVSQTVLVSAVPRDDDQVVPFEVGGKASAALVDGTELVVYPGAPHRSVVARDVRHPPSMA